MVLFWIVVIVSWAQIAFAALVASRTARGERGTLAVCVANIVYPLLVIALCMTLHVTGAIR